MAVTWPLHGRYMTVTWPLHDLVRRRIAQQPGLCRLGLRRSGHQLGLRSSPDRFAAGAPPSQRVGAVAGPTPDSVRPTSSLVARASPEVVVAGAGPGSSGPTTKPDHGSRAQVVVTNPTVGNVFDQVTNVAASR